MHVVAVEAHRRHHQRAVAVQLTVDVAATVLAVPFALLIEHIVQIRIGTERGLLTQIALDVATARVGERGKGEHGHVAELRVASAVIQNGLRGRGVEHGDLGQDRSGLLGSRRGLGLRGFLCGHRLGHDLGLGRRNLGASDSSATCSSAAATWALAFIAATNPAGMPSNSRTPASERSISFAHASDTVAT